METSDDGHIEILARFRVIDAARLVEFAKEQYAECWSDDSWEPGNLAEAVLEAVITSNRNPDNSEIGLEIITSEAYEV